MKVKKKKSREWWAVRIDRSRVPAEGWLFVGKMFAEAELTAQIDAGIRAELIRVREVEP